MQEVQVETIGTMSKREKTAYILDQMRLCLAKGDVVRTAIISKKVKETPEKYPRRAGMPNKRPL